MAKKIGKITKITNNFFQIDGKGSLNYKGNEKFKVGDVIEFHEKKGNIRDAVLYVKKEENIQEKKSEIQEHNIPNTENNNNIKEDKRSSVKKYLVDTEIDIKTLIKIDKIFENTEKIDIWLKKIQLIDTDKLTISKAQFSAFENQLEKLNFNFYSNEITDFIDKRIKRGKAPKFYQSFKLEVLESIQMLESEFALGDLEQKYKNKFNRKFIEYLKKYYRYELVLKEEKDKKQKENSSKGE